MIDRSTENRPALVRWFRSVIASPVAVGGGGEYFDRLGRSSADAAPVCTKLS